MKLSWSILFQPIPYRSQLQEKIEPGQTVIIKGSTIEESQRFTVSLHCKTADFSGNDVPLHLSFRFDEGKIFCDQKEFKDYEHRLPLSSISHLSIDGDLYLNQVHWGGKYYPVPYESGIAQGFGVQKSLLIFACPEKKAKRFNVNLLRKNGDIALHFNPRFDEKAVVRNALQAGEWGNEEKEGKIPFEKGVGFDLTITNEPYAFQIFVNGERFCSFAHRSDPHDITGLQIQGDLELTGIQIH
uniref:Galectin n=1 Tax=Ascaris lumbricoides TaxID=6252 RepID=A0A0M3IG00_ASCLU